MQQENRKSFKFYKINDKFEKRINLKSNLIFPMCEKGGQEAKPRKIEYVQHKAYLLNRIKIRLFISYSDFESKMEKSPILPRKWCRSKNSFLVLLRDQTKNYPIIYARNKGSIYQH